MRFDPGGEQQIRPEAAPFDLAQSDNLFESPDSFARHGLPRLPPPQDFRSIEESDAVGEAPEQERRVDFAASFDEQTRHVFCAEPF